MAKPMQISADLMSLATNAPVGNESEKARSEDAPEDTGCFSHRLLGRGLCCCGLGGSDVGPAMAAPGCGVLNLFCTERTVFH